MNGQPLSLKTCLSVFAALIFLTGLTVAAAFTDLGPFNAAAALGIASAKAFLVMMFFMQVYRSDHVVWVYAVGGLLWLLILLGGTASDYWARLQ